jgi:hypothetical protein
VIIRLDIRGQGHSVTGHEDPEGEEKYSSTPSLTSALDGCGGQRHAPAAVRSGKKTFYPLYRRLDGSESQSGGVRKISPLLGSDP